MSLILRSIRHSARRVAPRVLRAFSTAEASSGAERSKLTQFDTLHELQVNSCKAFTSNDLFGTHTDGEFKFMSYTDFDEKVSKTRSVLKQMGKK